MGSVKNARGGAGKKGLAGQLGEVAWSVLDVLACLYMVVLMVILPLHTTTTGYQHIGTEKCLLFRAASLGAWKAILPLVAAYLLCRGIKWLGEKGGRGIRLPGLSVTDIFALVYLAALVCSYLHTPFKGEAEWGDTFYGIKGWYLGFLTQLLLVGIYFMVSRLWQRRDWLIGLWLPVMAAVTLLGYLNRFGIYPLKMAASGPQYISTIGNINWYCGYVVTLLSGLAYYLWQGGGKKWLHIACIPLLGLGLASLVTQGSSSGIAALFILLGVFYLLSMRDGEKLQRFWAGCILLSAACVLTWVVRRIWPQAITYSEGTTDLLTMSPLPFGMLGASALCWLLVRQSRRRGSFRAKIWSWLGLAAWASAGVAVALFVVLLAVNTRHPGSIGALSGLGAFTFDASWGSNRGITWTAGLSCFLDQDLMGKLVGVGPDAMAMYIHSGANPALKQLVEGHFGVLILTNAHNEWLTVLIDEGLLGAAGYIGLMVTAIVRCLRAGGRDALAGAAGMAVLAYTANNMFSFQQVMGTSAVFLALGIGEACLRQAKDRQKAF